MKHFIILIAVLLMVSSVFAANEKAEYSNTPFTDDSIYISGEVYTTVGSLSVTPDTVSSTLFIISGAVELYNYAWVHLALMTDTTSAGAPEIVLGDDTTAVTLNEWWWRENQGDSKLRFPFSFTQDIDTDTTSAVKLYLRGKVQSGNKPVILHDVRIEAITNLTDQP